MRMKKLTPLEAHNMKPMPRMPHMPKAPLTGKQKKAVAIKLKKRGM